MVTMKTKLSMLSREQKLFPNRSTGSFKMLVHPSSALLNESASYKGQQTFILNYNNIFPRIQKNSGVMQESKFGVDKLREF